MLKGDFFKLVTQAKKEEPHIEYICKAVTDGGKVFGNSVSTMRFSLALAFLVLDLKEDTKTADKEY